MPAQPTDERKGRGGGSEEGGIKQGTGGNGEKRRKRRRKRRHREVKERKITLGHVHAPAELWRSVSIGAC